MRTRIKRIVVARQAAVRQAVEGAAAVGADLHAELDGVRGELVRIGGVLEDVLRALAETRATVIDIKLHAQNIDHNTSYTKEQLLSANHLIVTTHHAVGALDARFQPVQQLVESLSTQISAEREATMASNDAARDQLGRVAESLAEVVELQQSIPQLSNSAALLDRAAAILGATRTSPSQSEQEAGARTPGAQ